MRASASWPSRATTTWQLAGRGRRGGGRRRAAGRDRRHAAHLRRRAASPAGRGDVAGVTYVNDTKATNIDATLKALTAYSGAVHLILGGYDKGRPFDALAAATEGRVTEALLIGATAAQLQAAFAAAARGRRRPRPTPYVVLRRSRSGRAITRRARGRRRRRRAPEPGLRQLDQYRNYEQRGEHFIELVSELKTRS